MTVTRKASGRATSTPVGLAIGCFCSLVVTILGAMILAKLMETEKLPENGVGYGVMIMLLLASFLGAETAFRKIKRRRLLICLTSGGIYLGVLLGMTALLFGGQYSGVGVTALLILCGSGLAALLGLHENRGGKRGKIRIPNR